MLCGGRRLAELSWLADFNCNETQAGVGKNTKLLM